MIMMNRIPFLICTFISAILFLGAPVAYDRSFCVACLLVFLVVAGIIVYDDIKRISIISFNTLFLSSFFACSYVYPVFLVGKQSIIGEIVSAEIVTLNTLNKCSAICTVAISIYGLSYCLYREKKRDISSIGIETCKVSILYHNSKLITLIMSLICLFITYVYVDTFHGDEANIDNPVLQFYVLLLPMFLVSLALYYRPSHNGSNKIKLFLGKNKLLFILFALILLLLILTGDRAPIISYSLIIISCITLYIKKIKSMHIITFGLIGLILMVVLRFSRATSDSIMNGGLDTALSRTTTTLADNGSLWDVLADYIGMSVELNVGMFLEEKNGYYYPFGNFIRIMAAPIPFLPTGMIQAIYHRPLKEITPYYAINDYLDENGGTHSVIDIYMSFGIIGVLIVFFIYGWFVAKITNGINKNLFCQFFYIYMISQGLFIARNNVTNLYRSVVFSYVIYYLILHFNGKVARIKGKVASKNACISTNGQTI